VNQLRVDNFKHGSHVRTRPHRQQPTQHVIPDRATRIQHLIAQRDKINWQIAS
jgi:hypothetical protein